MTTQSPPDRADTSERPKTPVCSRPFEWPSLLSPDELPEHVGVMMGEIHSALCAAIEQCFPRDCWTVLAGRVEKAVWRLCCRDDMIDIHRGNVERFWLNRPGPLALAHIRAVTALVYVPFRGGANYELGAALRSAVRGQITRRLGRWFRRAKVQARWLQPDCGGANFELYIHALRHCR